MTDQAPLTSFEDFLTEAINVSHTHYQASHGSKPSGHGNWMIGVGTHRIDHDKHKEGEHYVSHNGPLSDAVKKAKALAKKNGHHTVHVLP